MYPYSFYPSKGFVDMGKVFVAMPFADEYEYLYADLIKPSIDVVNESPEHTVTLRPWRAKDVKHTRSGWLKILENLYTARIVLGVLTGDNPNVYYELGIAHAIQQIERYLLIAETGHKSKFDLKDLIYVDYDPKDVRSYVRKLSEAIASTLEIYDVVNDRLVRIAESRLSFQEFKVLVRHGIKSHFLLQEDADPNDLQGWALLCHAGLLRLSTKRSSGRIEYSYYWTNLGNAVLRRLQVITEEEKNSRATEYARFFEE